LAGLAASVASSDPLRTLWHAEAAAQLATAPRCMRQEARRHAQHGVSALAAVAEVMPPSGSLLGDVTLSAHFWAMAAAVHDLLDGEVPESIIDADLRARSPAALEPAAPLRTEDPDRLLTTGLRIDDDIWLSAASSGQPIEHLDALPGLVDRATYLVADDRVEVTVTSRLRARSVGFGLWARIVSADGLVDDCAVTFRAGTTTGRAVLALPASRHFEVHVCSARSQSVDQPDIRRRRAALQAAAELGDELRRALQRDATSGWIDLAQGWEDIAADWRMLGDDGRSKEALRLSRACREYQTGQRIDWLETLGPPSPIRSMQRAIAEDIASITTGASVGIDTVKLFRAAFEGTWTLPIRRIGLEAFEQLREVDPIAAASVREHALVAGLAADGITDLELLNELASAHTVPR